MARDSNGGLRRKVVVADDDPALLREVGALLAQTYDVVAHVEDGQSLVEAVFRERADVAVTDISMPTMSGIEATRRIRQGGAPTGVVILSIHRDRAYVEAAFEAGARGYVVKIDLASELEPAIRTVLDGGSYRSSRTADSE